MNKAIGVGISFVSFCVIVSPVYASSTFCPDGECLSMSESLALLMKELFGVGLILSNNLNAVILGWVKFFLALLGTLAFVAFIYAGFLFITTFGDEERAEQAKKIIKWATIGILVILLSYSFVSSLITGTISGG